MIMPAPVVARTEPDLVRDISVFVRGFSIEATRPKVSEIEVLAQIVPAGTAVYLSAIPTRPHHDLIDAATMVRAAGFEPVPHIAARGFASARALDDVLSALTAKASVRRVLVIAGDRDQPLGELHSALDIIETGLLPSRGIEEIGIGGYPEGHPRISTEALDSALAAKIEAAAQIGLTVHILTQFAFSAEPILSWLRRLRDLGIDHAVRIGLVGPTRLTTLLRYAQRCGVKASTQGLARHAGLAKHLFGHMTPDAIVAPLAHACCAGELGDVALHFFPFGGIAASARWAAATADGRITLDSGGGFRLEPPNA
jgi:methylenetetrahydrofolate reductase (NADPH)